MLISSIALTLLLVNLVQKRKNILRQKKGKKNAVVSITPKRKLRRKVFH